PLILSIDIPNWRIIVFYFLHKLIGICQRAEPITTTLYKKHWNSHLISMKNRRNSLKHICLTHRIANNIMKQTDIRLLIGRYLLEIGKQICVSRHGYRALVKRRVISCSMQGGISTKTSSHNPDTVLINYTLMD